MLFSEIYGAYFRTVERILREAGACVSAGTGPDGGSGSGTSAGSSHGEGISERRMLDIIGESAFQESMLVIPDKLKSGDWPLLKAVDEGGTGGIQGVTHGATHGGSDGGTNSGTNSGKSGGKRFVSVLRNLPTRPVTLLEKRWLKAILKDPRIRVFLYREEDRDALEELEALLADTEPLFSFDDLVYYDRCSDGDPYEDEAYLRNFHVILRAMHEGRAVSLTFGNRFGRQVKKRLIPEKIEYSSKDDKFRFLCRSQFGRVYTMNASRIRGAELVEEAEAAPGMPASPAGAETAPGMPASPAGAEAAPGLPASPAGDGPGQKSSAELLLTNERNALQRAMLHFSDLQKETEKLDEMHYRLKLYYYTDDETELVIRILSFGPMLQVTAPDALIERIRERIERQERLCGL